MIGGMRLLWLVVAACYAPSPPAGDPCGDHNACPSELTCVAGFCVTGAGDASIDTALPGSDAGSDGARADCWAAWHTGNPMLSDARLIAELSTADDERDPDLGSDGLSIVFARGVVGSHDLYQASRASRDQAFGSATLITALSSTDGDEGKLTESPDGKTVVFSSSRSGGAGSDDLWTAAVTAAGFGMPTETAVGALDDASSQLDPTLTTDGTTLYYSELSSVSQQILASTRSGAGTFSISQTIVIGGATARVADPAPSPDQLTLVYTGLDQPANQTDLFVATRASTADAFVTAGTLSVDTASNEGDATLSADGCDLVFSSQRDSGMLDLYEATIAVTH